MVTSRKLIQVRLSEKLHQELKRLCKQENRSMSNLVEVLLDRSVWRTPAREEGGEISIIPSKRKAFGKREN